MTTARGTQTGFSLVELLVAMLVTMIISGAVFTLLSAGQGAFRREPELTDRQQNIRLAMDLIQRDIVTAGAGLDPFEQAFSRGDNPGEAAPLLDGAGLTPPGPSGRPSDVLEILGGEGACMDVPVTAAAAPTVTTLVGLPACFPAQTMAAMIMPTGADLGLWGWTTGNVPGATTVTFPPGQPPKSDIVVKGFPAGVPTRVIPVQLARYAIANDTDGVPSLYRSSRGGLDLGGARVLPGPGGAAGDWQLVARGIEDLQVRYRAPAGAPFGAPACCGQPGFAVNGVFASLVQEVEVTLWARTVAPNLQGQTQAAGLPNAVRGSLVTVSSPRAVLLALLGATPPLWQ